MYLNLNHHRYACQSTNIGFCCISGKDQSIFIYNIYILRRWHDAADIDTWAHARYVKLLVAHVPGMPGTLSLPLRVNNPDMHHGTCVTHVPWCMPGSLTNERPRLDWPLVSACIVCDTAQMYVIQFITILSWYGLVNICLCYRRIKTKNCRFSLLHSPNIFCGRALSYYRDMTLSQEF